MGQYQARPSKSETDLEAREGELDICISDNSIPHDIDVDEQRIKHDPVFGSPIDSKKTKICCFWMIHILQHINIAGSYLSTLESLSSPTSKVSSQNKSESKPISRTKLMVVPVKGKLGMNTDQYVDF